MSDKMTSFWCPICNEFVTDEQFDSCKLCLGYDANKIIEEDLENPETDTHI